MPAVVADLAKVTNGVEEISNEFKVGPQTPIKHKKQ